MICDMFERKWIRLWPAAGAAVQRRCGRHDREPAGQLEREQCRQARHDGRWVSRCFRRSVLDPLVRRRPGRQDPNNSAWRSPRPGMGGLNDLYDQQRRRAQHRGRLAVASRQGRRPEPRRLRQGRSLTTRQPAQRPRTRTHPDGKADNYASTDDARACSNADGDGCDAEWSETFEVLFADGVFGCTTKRAVTVSCEWDADGEMGRAWPGPRRPPRFDTADWILCGWTPPEPPDPWLHWRFRQVHREVTS